MENLYKELEKRFFVSYPDKDSATYKSTLNFSDDLEKPFQRWYRYKEGYSTDLVKKLIVDFMKPGEDIIFDPFLGGGSTILGAAGLNFRGVGIESNPFSYFLSKVKLKNYTKTTIEEFKKRYIELMELEVIDTSYKLPTLSFSDKVFNPELEQYYMGLYQLMKDKYSENKDVYNLLKLGWLSKLEEVSNYKKGGNGLKKRNYKKPWYVHPYEARAKLNEQYNAMYKDLVNKKNDFKARIIYDDSKYLDNYIKQNSIGGIIFSPPYANCFDYTEIYKLELWFGEFIKSYDELKELRKSSLQSHLRGDFNGGVIDNVNSDHLSGFIDEMSKKDLWNNNIPDMIVNYFYDLQIVLEKSFNALVKHGFCSIVVGNSTYGGVVIPVDLLLAEIAENIGFHVEYIEVDRFVITSSQQYNLTKNLSDFQRESIVCLTKI